MDESLPITDVKRWEDEEFEWNTKYFYTVPLSIFLGKPKACMNPFNVFALLLPQKAIQFLRMD